MDADLPKSSSPLFWEVLRSGAKYASWKTLALLIGTIAGIINARLLGPEKLGIWITATIVFAYLPFLNLGVDHGAYQEIPLWRGRNRPDEADEVKGVYFTFALLLIIPVALAIVLFTLLVPLKPLLAWSLRVVAAMGVIACLGRWAIILLKSENRFGRAGLVESCDPLGRLLASPLIYIMGLPGMWLGSLAAVLASAAIAWRGTRFWPRLSLNRVVLCRLAGFGIPVMFTSIVQILSTTGDRMLVLGFLGTAAVGLYGLGQSFTQALLVSGGIIGPVLYPRITERYGQTPDPASLKNLVVLPTMLLGIFVALLLPYAWFGLPLVINWLLPAFQEAAWPAKILFLSMAIYLLNGTASYLLVALAHQTLALLLFSGGVALGLALEYAALRLGWGLPGVAAGGAISNLGYSLVVLVVALHFCRAPRGEQLGTASLALAPVLLVTAASLALELLWPVRSAALPGEALLGALLRATLAFLAGLPAFILLLNHIWPRWRKAILQREWVMSLR